MPPEIIPHSRPWITDADKHSVLIALDSGMIARGEMVARFESAVASYIGAPFAIACASGTSALVLALKSLGVCRGQEVILPTYVCRSVMDAVQAVGATPVLCDVGREWTATVETIAPLINERTSAIIAVHIFGLPMDIESIRKFKVPIIEDACQAFGATIHEKKLGTLTDIGVFSFNATKCLTTGEGGLVVFSDPELASRSRMLNSFCPMSDLSAALGLSQIARYKDFLNLRRALSTEYSSFFSDSAFPGVIPPPERDFYFRYVLRTKKEPAELINAFQQTGIIVRRGVDALLHRMLGLHDRLFPNAVKLFNSTISLPFYPFLKRESAERVMKACHRILLEERQ
jgi:UDP-4-amino-4-deoxy-L-arabinose-oxoglutarate aminotransferase